MGAAGAGCKFSRSRHDWLCVLQVSLHGPFSQGVCKTPDFPVRAYAICDVTPTGPRAHAKDLGVAAMGPP